MGVVVGDFAVLISKQKSAVAFADSALVRRGLAEKFRPPEEQQKKNNT